MRIRDGLIPLIGIVFIFGAVGTAVTWTFGQFKASPPEESYVGIRFTPMEPIGVRVEDVLAGSPAEAAGLLPGDFVYTLDGTYVDGSALVARIAGYTPQEAVTLGVQRDGTEHHITVQLAPQPESFDNRAARISMETMRNGMHLSGIFYDGLNNQWHVGTLNDDNVLYVNGLREGDIITRINGHSVDGQTRHQLLTAMFVENVAWLMVERDGRTVKIEVPAVVAQMMIMEAELTPRPPLR